MLEKHTTERICLSRRVVDWLSFSHLANIDASPVRTTSGGKMRSTRKRKKPLPSPAAIWESVMYELARGVFPCRSISRKHAHMAAAERTTMTI